MDWIHLAQVRDPWRSLVNTVTNLGLQESRIYGLAERLFDSQGLISFESRGRECYLNPCRFSRIL